jgi:3-oxoacyl-[acyl-carrier-protein] synthase II
VSTKESLRRVVVTGLGLVTPLGTGVAKTWDNLCKGKSGIKKIQRFDPVDLPSKVAGEIIDFVPEQFMEKGDARKNDLFIQYALAGSRMAIEDAEIRSFADISERAGVIIGVGIGGLPRIEEYHNALNTGGYRKVSPFFIPMVIGNLAGGKVSIEFGLKGPSFCTTSACASGAHAIGEAMRKIENNEADIMIAGGSESTITPLAVAGFSVMKALSTKYNDEPERASRPFDKNRDGFVIAEGAGVMVLEELEFAKKRGAKIYAELIGYGLNSDAYHITAPAPDGEGFVKCIELCLKDAGVSKEEVDYINAHGTSTYYNDLYETKAVKKVFGEHAYKLSVSSTKSMMGHTLGAAGGIEAVITVLAIHHGIIPPTINYEEADPECDLDYVPNAARQKAIRVAISNSFGFGGTNACLMFRKF